MTDTLLEVGLHSHPHEHANTNTSRDRQNRDEHTVSHGHHCYLRYRVHRRGVHDSHDFHEHGWEHRSMVSTVPGIQRGRRICLHGRSLEDEEVGRLYLHRILPRQSGHLASNGALDRFCAADSRCFCRHNVFRSIEDEMTMTPDTIAGTNAGQRAVLPGKLRVVPCDLPGVGFY